ncbi:MAG: hypothetical protein IJG32_06365 [Selenomonadaceae bacterium]|nr:hypothetical protein [Selenomonadaceae bacterium]
MIRLPSGFQLEILPKFFPSHARRKIALPRHEDDLNIEKFRGQKIS